MDNSLHGKYYFFKQQKWRRTIALPLTRYCDVE